MIEKLYSKLHILYFRLKGMQFASYRVGFRYGLDVPRHHRRIAIGTRSNFDRGVSLVVSPQNTGNDIVLQIGDKVYINRYTSLDASVKITIGNNVMIGPHCYITDHDHSFQNFPTDTPKGELPLDGVPTIIEDNVWLGSNVVVLKGVTIGKNSVIGAGSVVTKSIPANVVAVGNPCKIIKTLNE